MMDISSITIIAKGQNGQLRFRLGLFVLCLAFCASFAFAADPTYVGQLPSDQLTNIPFAGVSYYNGQHSQSFPLFALQPGGGLTLDVSLIYNGNVARMTEMSNRDCQASWVGLGFSLETEAITADHNFTENVADDKYYYIGPGGAVALNHIYLKEYRPADGRDWSFERVDDYRGIKGWIVTKEDGSVHRFGDFASTSAGDPPVRSATGYLLRWDSKVGVGVTGGDRLYPSVWKISRMEDSQNEHFIEFEYEQELSKLKVINSQNGNVTDYSYTRNIYPSRIASSDGFEITFESLPRDDYVSVFDSLQPEYYSTRRLAQVNWGRSTGEVIQSIKFIYDYLNTAIGAGKMKLLLENMYVCNSDSTEQLPPTVFSYFDQTSDPQYGALREIQYPTGGISRCHYRIIEADSNFARLNFADTNHIRDGYPLPPGDATRWRRDYVSHAWSRDCYIAKFKPEDEEVHRIEVGAYNGYWDFQILPDVDYYSPTTDLRTLDYEVAASDGWVVVFKRDDYLQGGPNPAGRRFLVLENRGGVWCRDTIIPSWSVPENYYVRIDAGKEFFVASVLEYGALDSVLFRKAYYYAKVDSGWAEYSIEPGRTDSKLFFGVQIANDIYAISIGATDRQAIYYGKFDWTSGELSSVYDSENGNYWPDMRWTVGLDCVAYGANEEGHSVGVRVARYDDAGWASQDYAFTESISELVSVVPLMGGVAWTAAWQSDRWYSRMYYALPSSSGFVSNSWTLGGGYVSLRSSGSSTLCSKRENEITDKVSLTLYKWGGQGFFSSLLKDDLSIDDTLTVVVSDEIAAVYSQIEEELWVSRFIGGTEWSEPVKLIDDLEFYNVQGEAESIVFDASRDVVVTIGSISGTPDRRIIRWTGDSWDHIDITGLSADGHYEPPATERLLTNEIVYSLPSVYADRVTLISGYCSRSAFQYYNNSFSGKAQYAVLDKVEMLQYPDDPNPIGQSISYAGGILDANAATPRFCRVTTTTPSFSGDNPEAYTIQYFYNDVDDDSFYDPTIYDILISPDLEDPATFGIQDGGYFLDGVIYRKVDSSATDGTGACLDTTVNHYEVVHSTHYPLPLRYEYFVPLLISEHARKDGVPSDAYYYYDSRANKPGSHRRVISETVLGSRLKEVDSVKYASYYSKPNYEYTWIDSLDEAGQVVTRQYASRTYSQWTEDVSQRLIRSVFWLDDATGDLASLIDTFHTEIRVVHDGDSLGPGKTVDTCRYMVGEGAVSCRWDLALRSHQAGEFCVLKYRPALAADWLVVDSLASNDPPICKSGTSSHDGEFGIDVGDSIMTLLSVPYDDPCSFINVSDDSARSVFQIRHHPVGDEIYSHRWIDGRVDKGIDEHGNVFCWTGPGGDTASAKFSPDGVHQIAGIRNASPGDCLLFSAEYDLDPNGVGYDGWTDTSGTGYLTNTQSLTGERSYAHTTPQYFSEILRASIESNRLSGTTYMLSFWVKSVNTILTAVTQYGAVDSSHSGPTLHCGGDWQLYQATYEIDTSVDIDSIVVIICVYDQTAMGTEYIDDVRFHPTKALVTTSVFDETTGNLIGSAGADNLPTKYEYDTFNRMSAVRNYRDSVLTRKEYFYSALDSGYFVPATPNYIKTIAYTAGDSSTVFAFSDGFGRALQTRSQIDYEGAPAVVVSGASIRDARGRTIRAYSPYIDLIGDMGVDEYSDSSMVVQEADTYYSGSTGPDAGGYPFSEFRYELDAKGRLLRSSQSAPEYAIDSDHTIDCSYSVEIEGTDTLLVTTTTDQDGIVTRQRTDARGRFSSNVSLYHREVGYRLDSLKVTARNDQVGQARYTYIDTSTTDTLPTDVLYLGREFLNDRGLPDSTWKVDYGTVRLLYDKKNNLRFMQNDKRRSADEFVYFIYDAHDRKIEEGLMHSASTFFEQQYADSTLFPFSGNNPEITYRWYYDTYDSGDAVITAPGKLVRVESADTTYYQQFCYYPDENYDLTITRLPINGGTLKAVRHDYSSDGAVSRLTVWPHYPADSSKRYFDYDYDIAGRLKSITRGTSAYGISLQYANYAYNPDGSVATTKFGVYDNTWPQVPIHTVAQKVDYSYNAIGALVGINLDSLRDTSTVVPYPGGCVTDTNENDHFGMYLTYHDDTAGYYNGRVWKVASVNSNTLPSIRRHENRYRFDDLSWLRESTHNGGDSLDRSYSYNALGNRSLVDFGSEVTYVYDTADHGSSRLVRTSDMSSNRTLRYDTLGNLVTDTASLIYEMSYDYRNLLDYARVAPTASGEQSTLNFWYDEFGMRIRKKFRYQHWDDCWDPGDTAIFPLLGMQTMSSSGGGTTQCRYWATDETVYLYDNGVLICTFNKDDQVQDLFVNGSSGPVAQYWKNDDDRLYYVITDHLGSPRILMHAVTDSSCTVAQFINYQPFGGLLEQAGSYNTDFKFTGKERDQHSTFNFDYFGARYYDPSRGTFTSIDKAGQFASGFVYGGNNPLMMVDPDGNFGFIGALIMGLDFFYQVNQRLNAGSPLLHAIGFSVISGTTSYMSGQLGTAITEISGSKLIGRTVGGSMGSIMQGGDVVLDLGVYKHDFATGHGAFVGFKGSNPMDWIATAQGYIDFAADMGKLNKYMYLSKGDRKYLSDIMEKYKDSIKASFEEPYPGEPWGGPVITEGEYEMLMKIGEKFYGSAGKLYDPLSWISLIFNTLDHNINIRKWLLEGLGNKFVPSPVHMTQWRLPCGMSVTHDFAQKNGTNPGEYRIHGNVDSNILGGVGFFGHLGENLLPIGLRRSIAEAYRVRLY